MKNLILRVKWLIAGLLFASPHLLDAQEAVTNSSYQTPGFFVGAGITYPFAAVLQGGGYGKNGWGGSINLSGTIRPSEHEPSNYDGGHGLFGHGRDDVDPDEFLQIGLSALKLFPLDKGKTYISLEIGPSFIWADQADNFVPVENPCTTEPFFGVTFCKPNYTFNRVTRFGIGGFARSAVHIRVLDQLGLSFGLFTHLNDARTQVGVDMIATPGPLPAQDRRRPMKEFFSMTFQQASSHTNAPNSLSLEDERPSKLARAAVWLMVGSYVGSIVLGNLFMPLAYLGLAGILAANILAIIVLARKPNKKSRKLARIVLIITGVMIAATLALIGAINLLFPGAI